MYNVCIFNLTVDRKELQDLKCFLISGIVLKVF